MAAKKNLTNAEFQVMSILWNMPGQGGFTSDILSRYDAPRPAYTTLATFLKILVNKGFVKVKKTGSKLFFTPKVSKETYANTFFAPTKSVFFDNDIEKVIAYFLEQENLTAQQAENIANIARSRVSNAE